MNIPSSENINQPKLIETRYGKYTPEQLVQVIKNNRIKLITSHRNDDTSSLVGRFALLRKTRELTEVAIKCGIGGPEIYRTLRILGIDQIDM